MSSSQPQLIVQAVNVIDPTGDVELIMRRPVPNGELLEDVIRYIVSSKAIHPRRKRRNNWRGVFSGNVRQNPYTDRYEILMPRNWDPEAFLCMMLIAHCHRWKVPMVEIADSEGPEGPKGRHSGPYNVPRRVSLELYTEISKIVAYYGWLEVIDPYEKAWAGNMVYHSEIPEAFCREVALVIRAKWNYEAAGPYRIATRCLAWSMETDDPVEWRRLQIP